MLRADKCGDGINYNAGQKEKTGMRKEEHTMTCGYCGKEISNDTELCPYCGAKTDNGDMEYNEAGTSRRKKIVIGGIVLAVAACLILIPVSIHNAKQKQYNTGVAYLEEGKFKEALTIFTELEDFDDAETMASLAQTELDYQDIDALSAARNYGKIAEILQARSGFYENTKSGRRDAALAKQYQTLDQAYQSMKAGNYDTAARKLEKADMTHKDSAELYCLCRAYQAEQEQDWMEILINLYAIQKDAPGFEFLENPVEEVEFIMLNDSVQSKADDAAPLLESIRADSVEAKVLKTTAEKGLRYDLGKDQMEKKLYPEAIRIFEELGDFLDSEECIDEAKQKYEQCISDYKSAEEYFANGEFYKAKKLYLAADPYEDAAEKADACEQPMPDNGAFKSGNGSAAVFTIKNSNGDQSVFVKLYDASENAVGKVFISAGKSATINMAAGSYSIKVGYGTQWYGETDLFGDKGSYQQLMNGSETTFKIQGGYTHTLSLGGVTNGNVGSKVLGSAGGM